MGCHFLLQRMFPTQGLNPRLLHLLHCWADSLSLSHLRSQELRVELVYLLDNLKSVRVEIGRKQRNHCYSVAKLCPTLRLHELQHARLPVLHCLPGLLRFMFIELVMPSNHLILSSSCPLSFPALRSFPLSQIFGSGGQSIGASTLVLQMNIQG